MASEPNKTDEDHENKSKHHAEAAITAARRTTFFVETEGVGHGATLLRCEKHFQVIEHEFGDSFVAKFVDVTPI